MPSLCELLGVPYTGSDSATLSICLDKALAKRLLVDVDTPAFQVLVTGPREAPPVPLPGHREAQPGGHEQGHHRQERVRRRGRACARSRASSSSATGSRRSSRSTSSGASSPWACSASDARACCRRWRSSSSRRPSGRSTTTSASRTGRSTSATSVPAKLTKDELRAVERACRTTFMTLGCRDVARVDLRLTPDGTRLRHRGQPAAGADARLQRPLPHRERREDRLPHAHRRDPERRHQALARAAEPSA